jgi:hypothetical protein
MGASLKKEAHTLPVAVRNELVALHKELVLTTKSIRKLIGDPRSMVRPCKGCGRMCTVRELRTHECKVTRAQR